MGGGRKELRLAREEFESVSRNVSMVSGTTLGSYSITAIFTAFYI